MRYCVELDLYDLACLLVEYKPGAKVRYYYPPVRQGNKFGSPWIGPFTVKKKVTEVDYRISRDSNPSRVLVTHVDNLKLYEGPLSMDPPLQVTPPDDEYISDPEGNPDVIDERILDRIGVPREPDPIVEYDSGDDLYDPPPPVRRSRRRGRPPSYYGFTTNK